MATFRIGTFNTENLFLRYNLLDAQRGNRTGKPISWEALIKALETRAKYLPTPLPANIKTLPKDEQKRLRDEYKRQVKAFKPDRIKPLTDAWFSINELGFNLAEYGPISKRSRKLTAKAILENDPDVIGLQEVESLSALEDFNRTYLNGLYPYAMVIDGNDPRQIDVGLISKHPLGNIRTHKYEPEGSEPTKRTFSRDCLEVDVLFPGVEPVTFLINHFKSQIPSASGDDGSDRREAQASRVAEIIKERFGKKLEGRFVVLGDLNAGPDESELQPLLKLKGVKNLNDRLPEEERWTHYFVKGKKAEQLDYVILSPNLAKANPTVKPIIERRGLGKDITIYSGPRFDPTSTGADGSSDHCPVFVDLEL
jgi:endonuclease/exonuclease/phosphatase family metal-dependent hydrolase